MDVDAAEVADSTADDTRPEAAARVGARPKQLAGEHAKALLRDAGGILRAAVEAGLSGPLRTHDLFLRIGAVTPGEYQATGVGLEMRWGLHSTPFGDALFVATARGLARLAFLAGGTAGSALDEARADWPLSAIEEDPAAIAPYAARAFANLGGGAPASIRLLVKGSPFQVQVWRALARISVGTAVTYGGLARALGQPGAARAVGTACGRNRIGYLLPCHRVIRETGALGGYYWGLDIKRSMLAAESATASEAAGVADVPATA